MFKYDRMFVGIGKCKYVRFKSVCFCDKKYQY